MRFFSHPIHSFALKRNRFFVKFLRLYERFRYKELFVKFLLVQFFPLKTGIRMDGNECAPHMIQPISPDKLDSQLPRLLPSVLADLVS